MCRFAAYLGSDVLLSDVLVKPKNSLILQSLHAKESDTRTNGDGFGVGWYVPDISPSPALFVSVAPAWNNQNLLHLASKVKSSAFFAHVRAASAGGVTHYNCHPFIHEEWMMMHNGHTAAFKYIKRHIRRLLDDDLYDWVKGGTDSEHFFALFLQRAKKENLKQTETVFHVLQETMQEVLLLIQKHANPSPLDASFFNFCLTDGKQMVATRYCSNDKLAPRTLHYAVGDAFVMKNDRGEMQPAKGQPQCILVSSERLTHSKASWQVVPPQHALLINRQLDVSLEKMKI